MSKWDFGSMLKVTQDAINSTMPAKKIPNGPRQTILCVVVAKVL
jgi:hypothetical protein